MVDVAHLHQRLAGTLGLGDQRAGAATAIVLGGEHRDLRLLVIERRARPGDPWSGDMALPGGRREGDEDLADTAARETHEETGVVVPPPFGRLPDVGIRFLGGHVATFLFRVPGLPEPVPEPSEVADAFWLPVDHVFDTARGTRHRAGPFGTFPAIAVDDDRVIWGLTLQMLTNFAQVVGRPLGTD